MESDTPPQRLQADQKPPSYAETEAEALFAMLGGPAPPTDEVPALIVPPAPPTTDSPTTDSPTTDSPTTDSEGDA